MSIVPLADAIRALVKQYSEVSAPVEVLRALSALTQLEEANIVLHDRMKKDIYELFGKDESNQMVSATGKNLMVSSRVKSLHSARTCAQYFTDAVVEFSAGNITRRDFGDSEEEEERDVTATGTKAKKGKRKIAEVSSNVTLAEPVYLRYQFNEQLVAASTGTDRQEDDNGESEGSISNGKRTNRGKGVSVMEAPCKSINLTITASRGAAGLQPQTLLDFQMLTAGHSPSEQQLNLQTLMQQGQAEGENGDNSGDISEEEEEEEEDSNDGKKSKQPTRRRNSNSRGGRGSRKEAVAAESSESEPELEEEEVEGKEEEEEEEDAADYYSVTVNADALAEVSGAEL